MNHQIGSFVIGVVSLMAVVLCAQTPPPQEQLPVFNSAANHVRVDVIATDKNDKPVTVAIIGLVGQLKQAYVAAPKKAGFGLLLAAAFVECGSESSAGSLSV